MFSVAFLMSSSSLLLLLPLCRHLVVNTRRRPAKRSYKSWKASQRHKANAEIYINLELDRGVNTIDGQTVFKLHNTFVRLSYTESIVLLHTKWMLLEKWD